MKSEEKSRGGQCNAPVVDPEMLKRRWAESNVSVPSYFIANACNKLYAFYTGKNDILKNLEANGGSRPHRLLPFESAPCLYAALRSPPPHFFSADHFSRDFVADYLVRASRAPHARCPSVGSAVEPMIYQL